MHVVSSFLAVSSRKYREAVCRSATCGEVRESGACHLSFSSRLRGRFTGQELWDYKRLRQTACVAQIKMEIYKNRLLIIATIGLIFTTFVCGSPKIRASKGSRSSDTNDINEERNVTPFVSCYESIPCGWALYTTERRQPFRRISTYTRNRL